MNGSPISRRRRLVAPLAATLLLVGLWELFTRSGTVDPLLIAGPVDVARAFAEEGDLLLRHTLVTGREALLGLALAIVFGALAGLVLHLSPFLRDATLPILIGTQAVPLVVIAPLLVIALGYGIGAKLVIVALACFFPVAVGTFDGLRSSDSELIKLMRSLGAQRVRTLTLVEAPGALPRFLGGVRIAATWAFISAVFAEYAGSTEGLGYLIARGTPMFETARVSAAVLILAAASLLLWSLVSLAERRLIPWLRHEQSL
ncbi:MAG: ABC transporter permease [Actinobacteria bacterium]|nr:ABC transporter permease [Actinomycetota bacterium]